MQLTVSCGTDADLVKNLIAGVGEGVCNKDATSIGAGNLCDFCYVWAYTDKYSESIKMMKINLWASPGYLLYYLFSISFASLKGYLHIIRKKRGNAFLTSIHAISIVYYEMWPGFFSVPFSCNSRTWKKPSMTLKSFSRVSTSEGVFRSGRMHLPCKHLATLKNYASFLNRCAALVQKLIMFLHSWNKNAWWNDEIKPNR